MLIENTQVFGFRSALRGMRNPMDSWAKSDTIFGPPAMELYWEFAGTPIDVPELPNLGLNDLQLANRLIKAGGEHRKFLRMIWVWVDVTAPRFWWTEADTYKVSTTRNSCSTMHKLGSRPLTEDDFEKKMVTPGALADLNVIAKNYREYRSPKLLEELKGHLPESFLQKATLNFNYETLINIYRQRTSHRLPQWSGPHGFCEWIGCLPYMSIWLNLTKDQLDFPRDTK